MSDKLEVQGGNWQELIEQQKKQLVNEIASEISKQHPDLFKAKNLSIDPVEIVKNFVLSRSDLIPSEQDEVMEKIMGQISGYGPLSEFFVGENAHEITEISVLPSLDGSPPKVFYGRQGRWHETNKVYFKSNEEVENYFSTQAGVSSKQLTTDNQILFVWMKDESRLTIIGDRTSINGITGTIRKSPKTRPQIDLPKLVQWGMMPDFARRLMVDVFIRGQAKVAVCGRTDSGKTTILRAMGEHLSPADRVIVAEPSFELAFPHLPHALNLVAVTDGREELVSIADLCRVINRSNPDHAIVGEILGAEVVPASQIAASTSGVFWWTGHAGHLRAFVNRLHGMFFEANMQLDRQFLHEKIYSMTDFIVFVDKDRQKNRTLTSIVEVTPDGFNEIIAFDKDTYTSSRGDKRQWQYVNPITKERLDDLAFRGADLLPEYTGVVKNILTCEGESVA